MQDRYTRRAVLAAALLVTAPACSDDESPGAEPGPDGGKTPSTPFDATRAGPHAVGTTTFELAAHDSRTLPVTLWYPAVPGARAEAEAGHPLAEMEPPGARRDQLAALVAAAPEGCTSRTFHAAVDAAAEDGSWPVVLFSHCDSCTRFSQLTVAERLASWGFIVAAPNHEENTLYDFLGGAPTKLTAEFLQVRGKDMKDVLDAVLAGAGGVPDDLYADPERVGMFGHSFGSITTGLVLQDDDRVRAGAMLAAPPENPLITGVSVSNLTRPGLFFLAEEDNSIGAAGNDFIVQNFENYPSDAWLLRVKDGGHWSFSDIAGIVTGMMPGCGSGKRQADPSQSFEYLDNDAGRSVATRYVSAFLAAEILGDARGASYLETESPEGVVTIEKR